MLCRDLLVQAINCPDSGCGTLTQLVDAANGTLLWSASSTWARLNQSKPTAGVNVTVPYGWNLLIDENVPTLAQLVIFGNVSFDPTQVSTTSLLSPP